MAMFGDMAIQNLAPKDANSSGRIIKNMRICGSGIYKYHRSEAPIMGITIPADFGDEWFNVYRPADMLVKNKDLYARVPIITGHHVRVNTDNAKQLAVGMVGDTVQTEVGTDGETYLYTTGTIISGDGIDAYEKFGELSVGYDPILEWMPGDYKGQKYQVVMTGLKEVNHLLICQTARGGHQCCVMDEAFKPADAGENNGGKTMSLFTRIFAKPAEKAIAGDAKVASAMLQSIKAGADAKTQVAAVEKMVGDKVDETLKGYFEDLTGDEVKNADKDTLNKAVDIVDAYVQKVMGDACEPAKDEKPAGDTKPADDKKEPEAGDKKEAPADKKEPEAGDKKEEPKSNGDAIDYEKLASMVAEKLKPVEKQPEVNGDELARLAPVMGGDDANKGKVTSDNVLGAIFG